MLLTAVMMVAELVAGWLFHSMALLADGCHMSSHVIALGLAAAAYALARRLKSDARFAFGTWKIEVLGGYTGALLLVGIAVLMAVECLQRLRAPVPIAYDQALAVAALGLGVNLVSAWMLAGAAHPHAHGEGESHGHDHARGGHVDSNLRSAYLHVAADAVTSVLAILALAGGRLWGLSWLDSAVGLAGSLVVAAWSWTLLRSTARSLVDAAMDSPLVGAVRASLEAAAIEARLHDLHIWQVGKGRYACILSLHAYGQVEVAQVRELLRVHPEIVHLTVEIDRDAVA